MSRKSKRSKKKHVPPSVGVRMQRRQSVAASSRSRWWIGGGVAAVVVAAAVTLWLTVGPGKPVPAYEPPIERNGMYSAPPQMQIDPGKTYVATISTAKGDIIVRLDAGAAPQTANNFVFLSREGFYDGLTFHRVEPGFVIQGGDPLGSGSGGPGYTVLAEIELPHVEGAIAMARRGDQVNPSRASSGSQFYIALNALPQLDGAYTVFGEVAEGMDVVKSIEIGDVIESVTIIEE
jgi:cyclophilin family peptidyl-prolyl cis-trans isomerase